MQEFCFRKGKWFDMPKYIVPEDKLMELMQCCTVCGGDAIARRGGTRGACVKFSITCTEPNCQHERTWSNSHLVNQTYVLNVLLSGSILFAGGLASKFLRTLAFLSICAPASRTFYRHQKQYLNGVSKKIVYAFVLLI